MDDIRERPLLPRRSASLRRQNSISDKTPSYFNLPIQYIPPETQTPPPPYFSPPAEQDRDDEKRWIDLLERQNTELMDQLTKLSEFPVSCNNPSTSKRPRPVSFHGPIIPPDRSSEPSPTMTTNILVQKQLSTLREELDRSRRRCAELSEIEARRNGLELRCLGLERVVEELMSAIDFMKTQSNLPVKSGEQVAGSPPTGLGIQFKGQDKIVETQGLPLRSRVSHLVIRCRRRLIPHQMRAVILVFLAQWRNYDPVDQMLGAAILLMGAMLGTMMYIMEKGQRFMRFKRVTSVTQKWKQPNEGMRQ